MVPFADLFNHKAAVVHLGGGYFVEDVCMEGPDSSSDLDSDDPNHESDDSDDPEAGQTGAAGDSTRDCSGDQHPFGDEQARAEVKLPGTAIAGTNEGFV